MPSLRRIVRDFAKYRLMRDFSLRSDMPGRFLMADLGVRFVKINKIDGAYLYESTKLALAFIGPALQDGTVLCFDEYFAFRGSPRFDERRAFAEFLRDHPGIEANEYAKFSSIGQSFLIHLR